MTKTLDSKTYEFWEISAITGKKGNYTASLKKGKKDLSNEFYVKIIPDWFYEIGKRGEGYSGHVGVDIDNDEGKAILKYDPSKEIL